MALVGLVGSEVLAQTTRAVASAPATQPVVVDLVTPKAAAKSLLAAVANRDVTAVRSVLDADPELNCVLAELLVASNRMAEAGVRRFGRSGDPIGRPMITSADAAKIDEAVVKETGDVATVEIAGHRRPMTFRKRGQSWRLAPEALTGADQKNVAALVKMLNLMSIAMNELARDIDSGKYQTSAEAERYVQEKLHAVMIETFKPYRPPPTQPASAPTTRP